MYVASAADERYAPLMEVLKKSAEGVGYETHIYDLGGLGMGIPFDPPPKDFAQMRRWKPRYAREARKVLRGPVTFLDADCCVLKTFDFLFDDEFDIAFVVKKKKTKADGTIQDRVRIKGCYMLMHDTKGCITFMDEWIRRIGEKGYRDQNALWELIGTAHPLTHALYDKGHVDVGKARVKLIPWGEGHFIELRRPGDIELKLTEATKVYHLSGIGKNDTPDTQSKKANWTSKAHKYGKKLAFAKEVLK